MVPSFVATENKLSIAGDDGGRMRRGMQSRKTELQPKHLLASWGRSEARDLQSKLRSLDIVICGNLLVTGITGFVTST